MSASKNKYGLIIKQKEEPSKQRTLKPNVLWDDEDDDDRKEEARKADKNRESKYAEAIIKAHARRQLEQFSREERQQIKEREKEGTEFADKEVFVTGAYRKQQEEVKKFREEEAQEALFNDATSVQRQKMWEMGMGRTLLNDLARDPTAIKQRKKEQKNVRRREDSDEEEAEPKTTESGAEKSQKTKKAAEKKSIYSSDSEPEPDKSAPPQKNFSGELKPGLNTVTKKATTHAERIRQRNFTPENSDSEDETSRRAAPRSIGSHRDSRRSESPRRGSRGSPDSRKPSEDSRRRSKSPEAAAPKAHKLSLKEKLKPKRVDKEARLKGLKLILKQRNTEEDIESARQRYFERREQGVVVPPL
ncbi:CBN-CCDC-55 protein [Caenorhabditis brenneri]|uniref:CBN-CCDC-55 protein n=1 Tax=Caenorhabditis brenneri TaxID=135651 RepID=G0MBQ2_CAEBE|nr:CBN-CCDC-55 protein [Caenorhabditis brenneri]